MIRLIAALVRHGAYQQPLNVPSAHLPHPLTKEGFSQAGAAANELAAFAKAEGWALHREVDSSRLLRAWQTAGEITRLLSEQSGSSFQVWEFNDLAERGLGSAANLSLAEIAAVVEADPRLAPLQAGWKADSAFRLPLFGAESLLEAGQRVAAHLRWRMDEIKKCAIVHTLKIFVGHGAALRHAAYHLGVLDFEHLPGLSMFHGGPVYLERLSNGQWRHVGGDWKLRSSGEAAAD